MSASEVSADLIAAYRAARYRVWDAAAGFELRVDRHSPSLAALLQASGAASAVFITACNPYSEPRDDAANRAANQRLRQALAANALRVLDAAGVDPSGQWPDEPGYLALGLDAEQARALGRRFGQNALVWAAADAVPRLVLLR